MGREPSIGEKNEVLWLYWW